jgi:hypothetical protein
MDLNIINAAVAAFNARLETTEVRFGGDFRSFGYEDDRFNDLPVFVSYVRPEFRDLLNAAEDDFRQENDVLGQVERDVSVAVGDDSAFFWDEAEFGDMLDPDSRARFAVYVFDPNRIVQILDAIERHPVISSQQRTTTLELLRVS